MASLIRDSTTNATYGHSATVMKKGRHTFSGRKHLLDISNRNQTSRKKQDRKLSAVTEELLNEKDIADEGFLHNHGECIKAQHDAMDRDDFLKTLGLANGCPQKLTSPKKPETPPPSPWRILEMLEKPIIWDRSAKKFDYSPVKSRELFMRFTRELRESFTRSMPESPDHCPFMEDRYDCINIKLSDSSFW